MASLENTIIQYPDIAYWEILGAGGLMEERNRCTRGAGAGSGQKCAQSYEKCGQSQAKKVTSLAAT